MSAQNAYSSVCHMPPHRCALDFSADNSYVQRVVDLLASDPTRFNASAIFTAGEIKTNVTNPVTKSISVRIPTREKLQNGIQNSSFLCLVREQLWVRGAGVLGEG